MKSTGELEHCIRESESADVLADKAFDAPALATYLNALLHKHGVALQDVIVACRLDRSYGYQLFNGTRRPTRDFLLRLAFFLHLSEEDTQRLLKVAGRPVLYARNRRDAAILYAITHNLTADACDTMLCNLNEEGLL